ncbi:hypothetical protein [Flavobacterium johnsoniae]|nr:hypothetical protein [Flavobacterium johnsoniae]WQG79528.1 hypothetical protein SR927_16020 [Flavobacterium johnsoniae UW101]SHL96936.1 hypothetical protein SAMN05444146_5081 [Flavobacterium johnsoniae]
MYEFTLFLSCWNVSILDAMKLGIAKLNDEEFVNSLTEEDLANLIIEWCEDWLKYKEISMDGLYVKSLWYRFETIIWRFGADLKTILKREKFKKSQLIEKSIICVLNDKRYGKGRETFALLVGDFKFHLSQKNVNILLNDEDVYGHVIISLRKLKMKGFEEKMTEIINSEKGWIKSEAKKYLDKSTSW